MKYIIIFFLLCSTAHAANTVVFDTATQTITNKTIDGDDNTIADVAADEVNPDTANFDGLLDGTDTTVQAALETMDDWDGFVTCFVEDGSGDLMPVLSTCLDQYFEIDGSGGIQPK